MNIQQLREIASRGGFVRWLKSGVIEQLVLGRKSKRTVSASGSLTDRHPIFGPASMNFLCEEVDPSTPMEQQTVTASIGRVRKTLRRMAGDRRRAMMAAAFRRTARKDQHNVA